MYYRFGGAVAFETTMRAPNYTAWHPTRRQFLF